MPYLTLQEAAEYIRHRTGIEIQSAALLRAGIAGALVVCAPFGVKPMYNASLQIEEDFAGGLLVIPDKALLEIETEGAALIPVAFGFDGTMYFPYQERTLGQLRVVIAHLEQFMQYLVPIEPKMQPACDALLSNASTTLKNASVSASPSKRESKINAETSQEPVPTIETSSKPMAKDKGSPSQWKMKIQAEATALCLRLYEQGCNPTIHSIKDDLATWCRENGIVTDSGIHPSSEYLRVHVLSSRHWKPPQRPSICET